MTTVFGYRPIGFKGDELIYSPVYVALITKTDANGQTTHSETRTFPGKADAIAYARAIGAQFTC
jgi:hypothetical protein